MKVERKVLEHIKLKDSTAFEIASEIMMSPKAVLHVIERLEALGILGCNSKKHNVNTVHRYVRR